MQIPKYIARVDIADKSAVCVMDTETEEVSAPTYIFSNKKKEVEPEPRIVQAIDYNADPIIIPVPTTAQLATPLEPGATPPRHTPQQFPEAYRPREWEYGRVYAPGEEPKRLKRIPVDPAVWQELGLPFPAEFYKPDKVTVRQAISIAATFGFLIRMSYVKADKTGSGEEGMLKSYILEPYSYRRKVTKVRGGRREYFFGFDVNAGHIKAFLVRGIKDAEVLYDRRYSPRWDVEIGQW